ncbi:MAG: nitrous oxide reductase accessory protein NosL [Candidatus Methylomirabilia bacterium]
MRKLMKCILSLLAVTSFLLSLLLVHPSASRAAAASENPKACDACGMDRTANAQSRMVIGFADGTSVGVCSVHCAAVELDMNKNKAVKSLLVADYATLELQDAKSAVWVVGGDIKSAMTQTPKWAFAKEEAAQAFIAAHGGELAPFDQVLKSVEGEVKNTGGMQHEAGHDMAHMQMGAGSQLVFNPAFGDMMYRTHPAGMWMLSYQYMHMNMSGLRDGTSDVGLDRIGYKRSREYDYMMIPTKMTMDMHMLMAMYGITDAWTVMVMPSYVETKMEMLMDMGPMMSKMGAKSSDPMKTGGLGDTEVRGSYRINNVLTASVGLSLPTGSVGEEVTSMKKTFRAPYDMQFGSGSYDLKPAITYSALSGDALWNWGAQAAYTWHTAKNENDWRYGDALKVNGWLQRAFGPASGWLRLAGSNTGSIRGKDQNIEDLQAWSSMPDADPDNYGGTKIDGAVGTSLSLGPASLGVEFGVPLHQDLNGLQMKTSWFLIAGLQVMF